MATKHSDLPVGVLTRDRRSLKGSFYPNEQKLFKEPDWTEYFKFKEEQEKNLPVRKEN